jgi:uncharacterized membrane protein
VIGAERLDRHSSVERSYYALAVAFGLVLIAVTPPFQVPDEPHHFYRAYQIAQGGLISEARGDSSGGVIPSALVDLGVRFKDGIAFHPEKKLDPRAIRAAFAIPLSPERAEFASFPGAALHSPVAYLPQAAGILVGKAIGAPALALLYLGRICNLLVATTAIALAIRTIPAFKNVLLLLALLPMSVYLISSLSADATTIALAFLFIAMVLGAAHGPASKISARRVLLLFLVVALLALCKIVYALLSLAFFLIPAAKFRSRVAYYTVGSALVIGSLWIALAWLRVVEPLFVPAAPQNISSFADAQTFILSHPLAYLQMIADNFAQYGLFYARSFVGTLGWLDTPLALWFVIPYAACLTACALLDGGREPIPVRARVLLAAVTISTILLVVTSAFFIWTDATTLKIGPAQGRYFIPVAPMALLVLYRARSNPMQGPAGPTRWAPLAALFALIYTVVVVLRRYYELRLG